MSLLNHNLSTLNIHDARMRHIEGFASANAPMSALFRKKGYSYAWDVVLKPASHKRWRYRGPHGWRSEIADTPEEAWALLVARMKADGWAPEGSRTSSGGPMGLLNNDRSTLGTLTLAARARRDARFADERRIMVDELRHIEEQIAYLETVSWFGYAKRKGIPVHEVRRGEAGYAAREQEKIIAALRKVVQTAQESEYQGQKAWVKLAAMVQEHYRYASKTLDGKHFVSPFDEALFDLYTKAERAVWREVRKRTR